MLEERHWNLENAPRETDTLYAREARLYNWAVSRTHYGVMAVVRSDTADHACEWVCATKWISRLELTAQPVETEG